MATINKRELPSGTLVSDQISELNEDFTPLEDTHLLSIREHKVNIAKPGFSSLFTLLSPSLVKTTLLLWVVYFANSFSYYGVVLMTSELSSGQSKCRAIVSHSNQLTDSSLYRNVFVTSFAGTKINWFFQSVVLLSHSLIIFFLSSEFTCIIWFNILICVQSFRGSFYQQCLWIKLVAEFQWCLCIHLASYVFYHWCSANMK